MTRLLITSLIIIVILLIFGAKDAAHTVADWTLTIIKWIFIIGGIVLLGALIISKRK